MPSKRRRHVQHLNIVKITAKFLWHLYVYDRTSSSILRVVGVVVRQIQKELLSVLHRGLQTRMKVHLGWSFYLLLCSCCTENLCAVKLKGQATAADGANKNHHQEQSLLCIVFVFSQVGFWQNIFLSGPSTLLVVIKISVEETPDDCVVTSMNLTASPV